MPLTSEERALFIDKEEEAVGLEIKAFHYYCDETFIEFTNGRLLRVYVEPAQWDESASVNMGNGPGDTAQYGMLEKVGRMTEAEWNKRCEEDMKQHREQSKQDHIDILKQEYKRLSDEFGPETARALMEGK